MGTKTEPLLLATLRQTCSAFPSQWEGTFEDGSHFYARWRHGTFEAGWGKHLDAAVLPADYPDEEGRVLLERDLADEDAYMPTARMLELLAGIVARGWAEEGARVRAARRRQ